ncbi:unnamed protein product [Musa acuminata var. zebrina]
MCCKYFLKESIDASIDLSEKEPTLLLSTDLQSTDLYLVSFSLWTIVVFFSCYLWELYQRVSSPDVLPLGNGKKHSLRTSKEDDADEAGRIANHSPSEAKSSRSRSASWSANPSPTRDHHLPHISYQAQSDAGPLLTSGSLFPFTSAGPATAENHHHIDGVGHGGGGDVLLRWGHKKRSRGPRTEGRAAAAAAAAAMPPPCGPYSKVGYLRPSTPVRAATASLANSRAVEERSGGAPRSEKRLPQDPPAKANLDAEAGGAAATEKPSLDRFMWPRIYVSLSRKEKEDDFLAMKGTKLPQRPKKRAKNIDRSLQYCFPGMWLSDLTRGRYEVKEKMRVRKKQRGLKGMESDSE